MYVIFSCREEVRAMVESAVKAQDSWHKTGAKCRAQQLTKFADNW